MTDGQSPLPPKITVPPSQWRSFNIIFAAFFALTVAVWFFSSLRPPTPRPALPKAEDVAEAIIVASKPQAVTEQSKRLDGYDEIFGTDWKRKAHGRQALYTHIDQNLTCQVLEIPRTELRGVVTTGRELLGVEERQLQKALRAKLPERIEMKISADASLGSTTIPQIFFVAWALENERAASLRCSQIKNDPNTYTLLLSHIKAFKMH
jgi:hypothetical protein